MNVLLGGVPKTGDSFFLFPSGQSTQVVGMLGMPEFFFPFAFLFSDVFFLLFVFTQHLSL